MNQTDYSKTLIIIPTYNEIDNIDRMIKTVFELYPEIHLLIVDDGSPDSTADVVKQHQKKFNNLHLIERAGKKGLASAYITGFKWGLKHKYDFFVEMDCDFSHDPKEIAELQRKAQKNELVIGSRYKGGIRIVNWPFHRLLLSYLASIYIRTVTRLPVMDPTGGFKCFQRHALEALDLDHIISEGYIFQFELNFKVWNKGLAVYEIPIIFYERRDGQSKMRKGIIIEAFYNVLKLKALQLVGKI